MVKPKLLREIQNDFRCVWLLMTNLDCSGKSRTIQICMALDGKALIVQGNPGRFHMCMAMDGK